MTKNHKDHGHDRFSEGRSEKKSYDDYNVLDPSPDIDLNYLDDDDDELSDYTLMDYDLKEDNNFDNDFDIDFDE